MASARASPVAFSSPRRPSSRSRLEGEKNVPGIWNNEKVIAWERITDEVHSKDSFIYLQSWALGRSAEPEVLTEEDPTLPYISASDVRLQEIKEYVSLYAHAAFNAVHRAGFDGVEAHGANGYVVDRFTQTVSNKRMDEYGGSVENRCRFALEVVQAVINEVGEKRVGVRLSPWGKFNDMPMQDPKPTFSYLMTQLKERYPEMASIHLIEPRVCWPEDREAQEGESNDFLLSIWISDTSTSRAYIAAGGYTRESAIEETENPETGRELIAFGRKYISSPDLPLRLLKDLPLIKADREGYYKNESPDGYIDYPRFSEQQIDEDAIE